MADRRLYALLPLAAALAACGMPASGAQAGAVPTTTATVVRTDIAYRQQVPGTLTYAGAYTVINQAGPGIFTSLAAPGATVLRGQVLYRVDDRPIPLFYGDPEWRRLQVGVQDGSDAKSLQANLVALGFGAGLRVDDHFDLVTAAAVRRWQASLGLSQTGVVNLGDIIYMPGPLRVASVHPTVGMPAQPGQPVIEATSPQHAVVLALDVSRIALVGVADPVSVTLPDGKTVAAGTIVAIGAVATATGNGNGPGSGGVTGAPLSATVTVTITLTDPAAGGSLDQAPVEVGITSDAHRGVLAVPVTALLAEPGGTYAVLVIDGAQRRRVAVTTGLFDDRGLVEVSGPALHEGMSVEVPQG